MFYDITPEELTAIAAYADGTGPLPGGDAVTKFNALHAAFSKKLLKDLASANGKTKRLETRVSSLKKKEDERTAAGIFAETVPGLDSLDVAKALVYCLLQKRTYQMTKAKVIAILYEMYASWLVSKHERLFSHHPQASPYGPQFWRVYNKIDIKYAQYEDFKSLAEKSPAIAAFTKNAAEKYYDWSIKKICSGWMKSKPYLNASPTSNDGKWGKEISDAEIYEWRLIQNNKK